MTFGFPPRIHIFWNISSSKSRDSVLSVGVPLEALTLISAFDHEFALLSILYKSISPSALTCPDAALSPVVAFALFWKPAVTRSRDSKLLPATVSTSVHIILLITSA